jgi:predicted outer membrane repeat protein
VRQREARQAGRVEVRPQDHVAELERRVDSRGGLRGIVSPKMGGTMRSRSMGNESVICVTLAKVAVVVVLAFLLASCSSAIAPFEVSIEYSPTTSAGLSFKALASATPTVYSWTFGDGSMSAEASPAHVYEVRGTYTVNLNVFDEEGRHASTSVSVTVGHNWYVPGDGGIQKVIDSAKAGDTILVSQGGGPVLITKDLEIVAVTRCTLTLVQYRGAGGLLKGFSLAADGEMSALGLDNATPTIQDCIFSNNAAIHGGAVYAQDSAARFEGCQFIRNTSQLGGGAVYAVGSHAFPSFYNCTFQNNLAGDAGGGILVRLLDRTLLPDAQCPHVEDCSFVSNSGRQNPATRVRVVGGAIHVGTGCRVILRGNSFSGNAPADVINEDLL